jgi:hypothetical protein
VAGNQSRQVPRALSEPGIVRGLEAGEQFDEELGAVELAAGLDEERCRRAVNLDGEVVPR